MRLEITHNNGYTSRVIMQSITFEDLVRIVEEQYGKANLRSVRYGEEVKYYNGWGGK